MRQIEKRVEDHFAHLSRRMEDGFANLNQPIDATDKRLAEANLRERQASPQARIAPRG
jgi:hypothetical protein